MPTTYDDRYGYSAARVNTARAAGLEPEDMYVQPDIEAVIDVAQQAVAPVRVQDPDGDLLIFSPFEGGDPRIVNVEDELGQQRATPRRVTGHVTPATVGSFSEYVERYRGAGTDIWVHPTEARVVAILNGNADPDTPGWGDHQATLTLKKTDQWGAWLRNNKQSLGQEAFANHIEECQAELVDPDPATFLEIAQTLHVNKGSEFTSGIRLSTGEVQFKYMEEVKGAAGRERQLQIPVTFTIAVPVFQGETPVPMTARLRYKVTEGHLSIGYILDRPEEVLRACIERITEDLAAKFPNVYIGQPS